MLKLIPFYRFQRKNAKLFKRRNIKWKCKSVYSNRNQIMRKQITVYMHFVELHRTVLNDTITKGKSRII